MNSVKNEEGGDDGEDGNDANEMGGKNMSDEQFKAQFFHGETEAHLNILLHMYKNPAVKGQPASLPPGMALKPKTGNQQNGGKGRKFPNQGPRGCKRNKIEKKKRLARMNGEN
jgi:hypothetical protein